MSKNTYNTTVEALKVKPKSLVINEVRSNTEFNQMIELNKIGHSIIHHSRPAMEKEIEIEEIRVYTVDKMEE